MDGLEFIEPNVHLFSFNNPYGACPICEGYGSIIGIDEELVIPNTALSIYENAIYPWRGESMGWYRDQLVNTAYKFDFPIHKPYFELTEKQKELLREFDTSTQADAGKHSPKNKSWVDKAKDFFG